MAMERKQGQWKLKWKRLAGVGMEELKLLLLARDEDKTDMSKVGLVAMGQGKQLEELAQQGKVEEFAKDMAEVEKQLPAKMGAKNCVLTREEGRGPGGCVCVGPGGHVCSRHGGQGQPDTLTHGCLKVHGGVPLVLWIFVDPL